MQPPVYLDTNATAPLAPEVRAAMEPWLQSVPANPASVHRHGQRARAAVEAARSQVASLLGDTHEVIFTSGGTEADNLAIWSQLGWPPCGHLLISSIEHPAILEPAAALEGLGVEVTRVTVGADGSVDVAAVGAAFRPETRLVSVMAANNEVGTVQPIAEIAALAKAHGVPLHCDAVQAAAWYDLAEIACGADLLSLSGHKIGGPPGIGALAVRPGLHVEPILRGGGQQRDLRPGTEPTALIVGFGAACARVADLRVGQNARIAALTDRLAAAIVASVPDAHLTVSGPRLPNTLHLCFAGCDANELVARLDLDGVAASAGSACHSGVPHPSAVLAAMGIAADLAAGALRLSLGYHTTEQEIERSAPIVAAAVQAVRTAALPARAVPADGARGNT